MNVWEILTDMILDGRILMFHLVHTAIQEFRITVYIKDYKLHIFEFWHDEDLIEFLKDIAS